MGSNREKSNIAIEILEKLPFLKGNKNYFDVSNNIFTDRSIVTNVMKMAQQSNLVFKGAYWISSNCEFFQ